MKRRKLLLGLLAAKVAYAGSVDHSYDVLLLVPVRRDSRQRYRRLKMARVVYWYSKRKQHSVVILWFPLVMSVL